MVFVDIGEHHLFESNMFNAFNRGIPQLKKASRCWDASATGGKAFDLIIMKKLPEGMTQDLARAVWAGDPDAARKAQLVMKNAGRRYNGNSIDGLYVLEGKGGVISMMSLGSRAKLDANNPSRKIKAPWNDADPESAAAEFDYALCSIVRPLGVGFSP